MRISALFKDFFDSEKAGGLLLLICTAVSIFITNSYFGVAYLNILNSSFVGGSITHWINDGLMTLFFLMIGLELERELYNGELSQKRKAILPLAGAIGGMLVPAGIYLIFNYGSSLQSGAGVPMATDIAFALAILSLLGNRVPLALKVFLTALAVIDDLGAILVIAIFYTASISWVYLFAATIIWAFLFLLNRLKVHNLVPYIIGGVALWYCFLHSGVHASVAGILLAFVVPFGNGATTSTSYLLQKYLHKPIAFFILPLFALANTAVVIPSEAFLIFTQNYAIGISLGLLVGKALGIFSFCYVALKLGVAVLPKGVKYKHIAAVSFLGGIGFTMSVFIAMLAFSDAAIINNAKLVILVSSVLAGVVGFFLLKICIRKVNKRVKKNEML